MEKVIYLVSYPGSTTPNGFDARARGEVAERLLARGAHRVVVNVADADVEAASGLRMAMSPSPAQALVSAWIDSANDALRQPFDEALAQAIPRATIWAYLVTESVPMASPEVPAQQGQRVPGMAQVAFLRRPGALSVEDWLDTWLNSHTQIAVDTQDTFSYIQNVVTRVLTPGAMPWHAIVEECFPAAAMDDPHVFFDAVGDDDRLARNQQVMFESVQRFIDLSIIDVLPTSRYDF